VTDDQELTRDEAIALADDLGRQLYRAEDRVAFVREMLASRTEPVDPATVLAWLNHQHCPRVESEQQQIKRLTALAEARQRVIERMARESLQAESTVQRVRDECHLIVAEVYGQHDEDDDGMREAVRRILNVVDGPNSQPASRQRHAGRSDPVAAVEQRIAALRSSKSQPTVTNHAYEGMPGHGQPCQAEAFGETCGAPWEQHEMRDEK
jgi:hypothetical protein